MTPGFPDWRHANKCNAHDVMLSTHAKSASKAAQISNDIARGRSIMAKIIAQVFYCAHACHLALLRCALKIALRAMSERMRLNASSTFTSPRCITNLDGGEEEVLITAR